MNKVTAKRNSKLQLALDIADIILALLFLGTSAVTCFYMSLAVVLVHNFEFSKIYLLFFAFPQFVTPLFILIMLIVSQTYQKNKQYKKALVYTTIGIVGTLISVASIFIEVYRR